MSQHVEVMSPAEGKWVEIEIGSVVDEGSAEIRTGPFGTQLRASDYTPDGVPVINVRNLGYGRIRPAELERVDRDVQERLSGHLLRHGDVVLGRKGAVDRHVLISPAEDGWMQGSDCIRIRLTDDAPVSPAFLSKALLTPNHKNWMEAQCSHGATMASLNQDIIRRITIDAPPRQLQNCITSTLAAFDELVEINERRIEVLEDLARSLYREWFVRFRFPGFEKVGLVDSELGPIPEGWDVGTLGGVARWYSGGTPSTKNPDYWNGSIPWITSGSLTSMLLDSSERRLTDGGVRAGSRLVDRDTVLFVVRGMSLVREFRVGLADCSLAFGQDCKALVANAGTDPLFLAFTIFDKQSDIQAMVELAGHGTGKLSTDRVKAVAFPLPPEQLQREFAAAIRPMRELMSTLVAQTRRHRGVRDLLLPRLVTGQLDISEIDLGVLTPPEAA